VSPALDKGQVESVNEGSGHNDLFLFSTKTTTSLTHPEITVTESIKQILAVPRENSATRSEAIRRLIELGLKAKGKTG
jgi:hypothetical protein